MLQPAYPQFGFGLKYGNSLNNIYPWLQNLTQQQNQGSQYLQRLFQGGGQAAGALSNAAGPSQNFYNQNMNATDPTGRLANLTNFAKKTYGQASQGINQQYGQAMSNIRNQGGVNPGGVNPRFNSWAQNVMGAQRAGNLGTLWGNLQGQETAMRDSALQSTADYRKAMADASAEYAQSLSGATAQDQQFLSQLAQSMGLQDTSQAQMILQFLTSMLPQGQYGLQLLKGLIGGQ